MSTDANNDSFPPAADASARLGHGVPTRRNMTLQVFGRTDVGLIREHNEDNFLIANLDADFRTHEMDVPMTFDLGTKGAVLLVCGGMGGAAAGEVASLMAVDSISSSMAAVMPAPPGRAKPSRVRAGRSASMCHAPAACRPRRSAWLRRSRSGAHG